MVGARATRSVLAWALGYAAYIVGSVSGYAATYKTAAARQQLARSFGSNPGLSALLGPARHLDTVAGFAAWRCLTPLGILGGIWGLLAATRLLRGEEEAGRWELVLAGWTTRRRAAAQALAGLATGWLVLLAITALATVLDGRSVHPVLPIGGSLFFSLTMAASAAMFLAVGAFTSQLARTRRRAASIAGGVLGVAYLVRLVADTVGGLRWLRWASPLGWVEELHPFTAPRPVALVPIAALVVGAGVAAVYLAGTRDAGASILPEPDTAQPRTALLRSPTGLAARLLRPMVVVWLVAIAGLSFVQGLVAKGAAGAVSGSAAVQKALGRLGATNQEATLAYLGLSFLTVALILALAAAAQVVANREEEATGRLENLLVRPLGRFTWLAGRLGVEGVVVAGYGLVAGAALWAGAASQHSGVGFGRLVEGGVNTVPPALFLLGFGAFVQAAAPRVVAPATYGLVAWAFLIEFVGSVFNVSHWVLDTSILYHMAPVPAASAHWASAATMAGLGIAGALLAGAGFRRRDLIGA